MHQTKETRVHFLKANQRPLRSFLFKFFFQVLSEMN